MKTLTKAQYQSIHQKVVKMVQCGEITMMLKALDDMISCAQGGGYPGAAFWKISEDRMRYKRMLLSLAGLAGAAPPADLPMRPGTKTLLRSHLKTTAALQRNMRTVLKKLLRRKEPKK